MKEKQYNYMAKLISILLKLLKHEKYNNSLKAYLSLGVKSRDALESILKEKLPELYNDTDTMTIFHNRSFCQSLSKLLKENTNIGLFLMLLRRFDLLFGDEMLRMFGSDEDFKCIKGLNTNIKNTHIILLPRCSCTWERSHRGRQNGIELLHIMDNFFYVEVTKDGTIRSDKGIEFRLSNILIDESLFASAYERGKLVVGLSPVLKKVV